MKYLNSSFLLILLTSAHALSAADPATWNLWPDNRPGEVVTLPPESDRTTDDSRLAAGKRVTRLQNVSVPGESDAKHPPRQDENTSGNVIRLTDVTDPAFIVLEPEASFSTGAGVIVCPGGGGRILAWDKEGLEVGQWFNTLDTTEIILFLYK